MKLFLEDDNNKALPKKVQKRVNDFIDNLKNVPWFNPSPDLKKKDVIKQAKFTLKCFGCEAEIEFRKLENDKDWDSAWESGWDSARDSARDSVRDSVRASGWASAKASAKDSARASGWVSERAAVEVLILDKIKDKYPHGAFIQLFKLWEMGLYPVGILKENKKFVIFVPPCKNGKYPFTF